MLSHEELDEYTGGYSTSDDAADVARHAVVEHVILRIVLRSDVVAHSAGHWHGTETRCTDEGIDFLLREQVEQLDHHDTRCDAERKSKETADNDANGSPVKERLAGHGRT